MAVVCPKCNALFRIPDKLLPGSGDISLGHRWLGTLQVVGALVMWLLALGLFASGPPENIIFGVLLCCSPAAWTPCSRCIWERKDMHWRKINPWGI